jgi:nardilysin
MYHPERKPESFEIIILLVCAGTIRESCIIELLLMLMEEPLFDQLRTQEQLGYEVSSSLRDTHGILGFSVTVVSQACHTTVDHVETRIQAFLDRFLVKLKSMPQR